MHTHTHTCVRTHAHTEFDLAVAAVPSPAQPARCSSADSGSFAASHRTARTWPHVASHDFRSRGLSVCNAGNSGPHPTGCEEEQSPSCRRSTPRSARESGLCSEPAFGWRYFPFQETLKNAMCPAVAFWSACWCNGTARVLSCLSQPPTHRQPARGVPRRSGVSRAARRFSATEGLRNSAYFEKRETSDQLNNVYEKVTAIGDDSLVCRCFSHWRG